MSSIDITSRLERRQARKLLAQFFSADPSRVSYTKHSLQQMNLRDLLPGDIYNVLRSGQITTDPEFVNGSWRYRIETRKITVVFAFNSSNKIKIITAWRNI